jgi:cysteine-rich repeat protein
MKAFKNILIALVVIAAIAAAAVFGMDYMDSNKADVAGDTDISDSLPPLDFPPNSPPLTDDEVSSTGEGSWECGDGVVYDEYEDCDNGKHCVGGGNNGADCTNDSTACLGGTCEQFATNECNENCEGLTADEVSSIGSDEGTCGDGIVQASIEECDDGNSDNGDGCDSACAIESVNDASTDDSFVCGDGIISPELGEDCDNGKRCTDDTDDSCHGDSDCLNLGTCVNFSTDECDSTCMFPSESSGMEEEALEEEEVLEEYEGSPGMEE